MTFGGSAIARGVFASPLVRLDKLAQRVLIAVSDVRRWRMMAGLIRSAAACRAATSSTARKALSLLRKPI
jgi:hypothetical protein